MKHFNFHRILLQHIENASQSFPSQRIPLHIYGEKGTKRAKISLTQGSTESSKRKAAVLIPLCNRNGVASVVFTLRSKKVGTHKGHVSFPGGHIEQGETPVEAVIRETKEELGDGIGPIKILGICETIPAITGTLVTPIIGFIEKDISNFENLSPSIDEVEEVFAHSIEELSDTTGVFRSQEFLTRPGQSEKKLMPFFGSGPKRVWGLTALIMDSVLRSVIQPAIVAAGDCEPSAFDLRK